MTTNRNGGGERPPDRSRSYHAEIQRRREELHTQLTRILASSSQFTWELGCGHGHFLTAYAQAHPQKLCIGIDLAGERVERALRKRDRARLDNLFFLRAEARFFLETLPAGATFSDLFVLFPDPWPKLRHQKHRIVQPEFLSAAAARGTNGTQLYFRTDFHPYFEYARQVLDQSPYWQTAESAWPFEFVSVFQSRAACHHSIIARRTETRASLH